MLGRHIFFLTILLLGMAVGVCAQPAWIAINYYDDPPGTHPALGCPCTGGTPFPDGTAVCVFRDINDDGPDLADTLVRCWSMNGLTEGLGAGYFAFEDPPLYLDHPADSVYVLINSGCCWHTPDYAFPPGSSDRSIPWADWTCSDAGCFPAAGDREALLAERTEIGTVYPNPFNPETRIEFAVSVPGEVSLTIYNLSGQRVRTLVKENYSPGNYSAIWDGKTDAGVPAGTGVYLCRLNAGKIVNTGKLFLLR